MGKLGKKERDEYTYEAWFRSPLEGKFRRELLGGNTNVYSTTCFRKELMYHVAVTKSHKHGVHIYVNGRETTFRDEHGIVSTSHITKDFGSGFTDGGQLFNVRIWDYARAQTDL